MPQGIKAAEPKFEAIQSKLEAKVDKPITIFIDYEIFVKHQTFLKYASTSINNSDTCSYKKKEYSGIIEAIWQSHIERLLFDSSEGLATLCSTSPVMKKEVQARVHFIVFRYDPENTVRLPVLSLSD